MTTRTIIWDGVRSQSLENLDRWIESEAGAGDTHGVYAVVPVLYRCVWLRANAVSRVPVEIVRQGTEDPVTLPWEEQLPELLWLTEASLCLYGAAYWLRLKTRGGQEAFRWLAAPSIRVRTDESRGLIGFTRRVGALEFEYTPDEVVWFWTPSINTELGAGVSPAQVALTAAGIMRDANEFAAGFFARGAIPAVLLSVEGNPPQAEMERLETWWKRLTRGVKRAWEAIAVRAGVDVKQLQMPVNELAMPELLANARQQIAVAFGVPQTLLEDAANYATAKQHHVQFYTETIDPECGLISAALNRQVFAPKGLEFRFRIQWLDVMQTDETERAASLKALVDAGLPLALAMQSLGYDLPEGWTWEMIPGHPSRQQAAAEAEAALPSPQEEAPTQRKLSEAAIEDLRRWRDKAARRGGDVEFESEAIPGWLQAALRARLQDMPPRDAFRPALRAFDRGAAESALARDLAQAYAERAEAIVQAVTRQAVPDEELDALATALRGVLSSALLRLVMDVVLAEAAETGIGVDYDEILSDAAEWASRYAYDLVRGIGETQRGHIQNVISRLANGEIDADGARAMLEPLFGRARANMIAATEVTRAMSQATLMYQRALQERGLASVRRWLTAEDERVCPVCGALDHKTEDVWSDEFPDGPPAHVNCRCRAVLEWQRR